MRLIKAAVIVLASLAGSARAEPSAAPSAPADPSPSRPTAPRALSADTLSDAEFAFIARIGKRRLWRSHVSATRRAKVGRIQSLDPGEAFATIARALLPAELKPLQGARVRLQTASGEECEVTLKKWGVLAEYNSAPEGEDEQLSDQQLSQRAYTSDESAQLSYAVDITEESASCEQALWARLATLPKVASYPVEELKGAALERLRPLLHKTANFIEAQKRYREEHEKGSWDRLEFTSFVGFATQVEETRHLIGDMNYFEGCSEFSGHTIAFYEQLQKGHREQPNELSATFAPERALDLNGDGFPEWISEYHLVGWNGTHLTILREVEPESWWCPC